MNRQRNETAKERLARLLGDMDRSPCYGGKTVRQLTEREAKEVLAAYGY